MEYEITDKIGMKDTGAANVPPKYFYIEFVGADWRSDPKLRACSLAARGLWIEMIVLMHESGGRLLVNGHAPTVIELARQVGATHREVRNGLEELRRNDVFSTTDQGVIYCRRMVRQVQRALVNSENGRKGGAARWAANQARHFDDHVARDHHGEHDGEDHRDHDGDDNGLNSFLASSLSKEKKDAEELFKRFWAVYPLKVAKKAASREWLRIRPVPNEEFTDKVIAAVEKQTRRWDPDFIPHPRTWLHNARWEDQELESKPSAGSTTSGRAVADADETAKLLAEYRKASGRS